MSGFKFQKGNKFGKGTTSAFWTPERRAAVGQKHRERYAKLTPKEKEAWAKMVRQAMVKARPMLRILNSRKRRPMSEEHKTKISLTLRGRIPANIMFSNTYQNIQNGEYDINGKVKYFRSKWEANIALYLDFLKKQGQIKDWHYESKWFAFDQIRHGTTRYLPDFEVENLDGTVEYWEVKGYMDSRSKVKLKRMRKYYPETKLVLIDRVFMASLKKQHLDKLLKFY